MYTTRKLKTRNFWLQYDANYTVDLTAVLKNLYDGTYTGDTTGDVTGDVTGNVVTPMGIVASDVDANDTDGDSTFVELDGSTASCDITNWTPTRGTRYVFTCSDVTTANPTVTSSAGVTFDGTNNTLTFDLAGETIVLFAISTTQCVIVENIGAVGLTSV